MHKPTMEHTSTYYIRHALKMLNHAKRAAKKNNKIQDIADLKGVIKKLEGIVS